MTEQLVLDFIREVWNGNSPASANQFLHPDFKDHSLPPEMPAGIEGLQQWITITSASFQHETLIEEQITEGERSVLRIRMRLKHIGPWRGIEATGRELFVDGYRLFRVKDGRIIEHRALVDGASLESRLRGMEPGCKVGD